jgi:LmbE family N-acetylglucosaminyl deacetylase
MNIILSPHFDDAVLSLGGLLAREGDDTLVATFFAGIPSKPLVRPWDTACGFTDSTEAMRARTAEDRDALHVFGISDDRVRNYRHLDSWYRFSDKRSAVEASEPELKDAIKTEIDALISECPVAPKVFVPGFEIHVDHKLVKQAAVELASTPSYDKAEFFFYQDLPSVYVKILAKKRSGIFRNLLRRTGNEQWDYSLLDQKAAAWHMPGSPLVIPLSQTDMEKKLAGISCYRSQVDHLGTDLLAKVKRFAAEQARFRSANAPFCEVVYTPSAIV